MLNIYVDESCKDGIRHLILGGIAIELRHIQIVSDELLRQRDQFKTFGEVKWQKVSKAKLPFYKAYVDVFFNLSTSDLLQFHALHVNTSTFNHGKWNQGSSELGFNKLIYQLLLHKFGRRYGGYYRLYVFLDERTTQHTPETIRPMLNAALAKEWGIPGAPFRRLTFQDSKKSEILQLNDLLIGAIGFRKNGRHQLPEASPAKVELAEYIARQAVQLEHPIRVNSPKARRFTLWAFEFKKGVLKG